ncbi:hypothetical protein AVEN_198975-1 [Araneus ventricosus]|uniref:Uncharacterized protein n=1 Tax=Araneus ventricosus TaxID=182803 RepID=A0A4Y2WXG7_ARAVE|nr:hypothetical protein AVEN_198975-1 [Araneus ventricosus]
MFLKLKIPTQRFMRSVLKKTLVLKELHFQISKLSKDGEVCYIGKMCPDPVLEESIGISVGDLLADTSGPGEMVMSPESCGKTDLKGSSPFGHSIISSEEATAKEKRRIVALVDSEAIRRSELLQDDMKNNSMDFKKKLEDLDSVNNVAIVQNITEEVKVLLAENLVSLVSREVNTEKIPECGL